MSLPEAIHPGTDTTGERCGYGQQGPLFFLPIELGPGPSYTYECVVPEGTAIYVYMSAGFCSTVDPEPSFGRDVEELQACVDNFPDALGDLVTEVNGQEVANVDSFGATSPPFTLNIPADNIFAEVLPPGVALAVASTYAFIIAPPRPGAYVIRERWTTRENTAKTYTVYVTVEAPQIIEPTGTEPPQTTDAPDATEAP
jgi:hypothetical protein